MDASEKIFLGSSALTLATTANYFYFQGKERLSPNNEIYESIRKAEGYFYYAICIASLSGIGIAIKKIIEK